MTESTLIFYKNILLTPFFALGTMYAILEFARVLHFSLTKIRKLKIIGLFIVFYCSIVIFYKNRLSFPPLLDLLTQIGFSLLLGVIWTWILIELCKAIGRRLKNPRIYSLWLLISIIAFGLFSLTR